MKEISYIYTLYIKMYPYDVNIFLQVHELCLYILILPGRSNEERMLDRVYSNVLINWCYQWVWKTGRVFTHVHQYLHSERYSMTANCVWNNEHQANFLYIWYIKSLQFWYCLRNVTFTRVQPDTCKNFHWHWFISLYICKGPVNCYFIKTAVKSIACAMQI